MFYDVFLSLCEEFNVTPAQVRKDLSISQSTMASWKSRNLTPNAQTLIQLAEYFHTTPAYLAGNPMAKDPIDAKKPGSAIGRNFSGPVTPPPIPHTILGDNPNAIYDSGPVGYMARQEAIKSAFFDLNGLGQLKAIERILELGKIPEYQRGHVFTTPQSPQAPQEGTDTTPPPDGSEEPPKGK